VLRAIAEVARRIDTVVSVDVASRYATDGSLPAEIVSRQNGLKIRPNGKTNLGLGRPFVG
jgi:hypothetical protein